MSTHVKEVLIFRWQGNRMQYVLRGALTVIDWEDAAIGDPLADIACCRLELRYKFGQEAAQRFTRAYARH